MKKKLLLITMLLLLGCGTTIFAQEPPHPGGNPSDPGSGAPGPVGGGAPVGSGFVMLLVLGAGYGATKIISLRNTEQK